MFLVYPPNCCIKIVLDISWDDCNTQEKLETRVMQISFLGGRGGGGVNKVLYGLGESSEFLGFLIPVISYITYIRITETILCCYLAMIPSCYLLLSTCQEALLHFLHLDLDQLQAEQSTTTITLRTCRLGLKQMITLFHTITKFKEGNENTVNKTDSFWIHVDFIPCKS